MSRWETTSVLEAGVSPASVWQKAYADPGAWPTWNAEINAHNNTIYIDGPLAPLWRRILGPAAARTLPGAQRVVVELAESERPAILGD